MPADMMNTARLRIEAAELIGLAGRLFEAELNGNDNDCANIKNAMREAISQIQRWRSKTLDAPPQVTEQVAA